MFLLADHYCAQSVFYLLCNFVYDKIFFYKGKDVKNPTVEEPKRIRQTRLDCDIAGNNRCDVALFSIIINIKTIIDGKNFI